MSNKFVVIDLETTGNTPKKGAKIIQFAAVVIEGDTIVEQYSSFINPEQPIPPFIEELTGIDDHIVKDAPLFAEIAPRVLSLLDDAYFVAHNVHFDLSFLQEELIEAGYHGFYGPVVDTVELSRILFPAADSYKLSELSSRFFFSHDRPHQADSDAYVTAELLLLLLNRLESIPTRTLKQLSRLAPGLKSDIHILMDELIREKEKSIEILPDFIDIYRGIALKRPDKKAKDRPGLIEIRFPYSDEEKENLMKGAFPNYEKRTGQFKMMDLVYQSFADGHHSMIEAGTGVGKSLGYLIPAAFFSIQTAKAVIVSTYTTLLQEQLLTKDIPLLNQMLPFPVKTVLLKGRNHFISLAKFEQSLKEEDDNYDTTLTKMQILIWLLETETGDVDELNLSSGGRLYWHKIKNDSSVFLHDKAWRHYDFYLNARKNAQVADIVITNHSLLLSDLTSDHSLLPDYDYAILDEAHHFEKAAGKYFGFSIDYLSIRLLLGQLGLYEQKQLFFKLEKLLNEIDRYDQLEHTFEINALIGDLQLEMDEFFKTISLFANEKLKDHQSAYKRIQYRLTGQETGKTWKVLVAMAERFSFQIHDLVKLLEKRLDFILKADHELSNEDKAFLDELASLLGDFREVRENVKSLFLHRQNRYVTWIEVDLRAAQNATAVYGQPVDISNYLQEYYFSVKKSAVLTSATLTVKQSFDYMMKELGLYGTNCRKEVISSPFQYKEKVKMFVPNDLPEINAVSIDDYTAAISEHIISIAEATKGRMLILFTSYEMLKKTYELLKESGFLEDFALIAQGISGGSRTRLTRSFQRFDKSILFGTSSFWEGIDIPGEDLSCLVIVRLPFSPPDEPVTEAKCEIIEEKNGNPFYDYSLPEAVLRFKQGVGRLIRTENDRGLIVVFDRRIISTKYGKAFLQSIPAIPLQKVNIDEIVEQIYDWL
ncbi:MULTISPECIES: ATP-dependent DNA helicase DinG [Bacillus]|uniref:ATP-dependent DNA helicase DinG n=1 Tax=Bacillus TaxID=1386 RepID=UPI000C763940|nr:MULTISPECIES: ATP-dependent DNA helicase DinG [Bacillus]PLR82676.1 ATP-dependent helicase DinG [Bacillus sp. V33-4]RSK51910.1 ATP-dependent helicase DinG [Bacillus canaveralius]